MFKKYFITGLLVWIPIVITLWVLNLLVNILEAFVPNFLSSKSLLGFNIPGFRLFLVFFVILITGILAANLIGRTILNYWESLLGRIPLVRSIYNSVKQVSDTILSPENQSFKQAVLIEYPRKSCWTIAFLTGVPGDLVLSSTSGSYVSVYVPTTPNPTSGFFLILKEEDIIVLNITVDNALKYIVSMGVVSPYESNL
ncbi:hypothetical protein CDSE_0135 [Candidatus Kinetoplastibacterium desouzaii TCC079E]|uniref:DUF502 domain-containing protein n=1 Tax=Candidatus Kinetoplastidibacterium desouzai TCC079E TaxID=1208919 RepID=M1LNJ1_9PROT|nr:DUF502 domain-containing protein [Candidatus Kinetoplastibacterium desouzaii]AGF47242.1 hypothetical protein CDSE_0135 [Candidatus Kinetoplastibacterium desouzaii TCC079E]